MNPGDQLGAYEIKEPLGAGGMGEVWRARDPRLDRDVAIKVLPEDFAADAERLARFEREAKLLAQLSHTNIAGIYGLEDADGVRFIAMECVEGETLAERVATGGRIDIDDALEIAIQIAEALEAAHEAGIVHRDLKPANVKVALDGKVKVLDFGLAKVWEVATAGTTGEGAGAASAGEVPTDISHSPTMMAATGTGVILGTAAYMSPEQARGKPVDKRADIWAFGCLLFEMLTANRAFGGETISDTLAAILKEEPDWDLLPEETPANIGGLLRRCLRKDPRLRLRDIGDARIEIAEGPAAGVVADTDAGGPVAIPDRTPAPLARRLGFGFALVVGAGVVALAGYQYGNRTDPAAVAPGAGIETRTEIGLPPDKPLALDAEAALIGYDSTLIALSPDGAHLVYSGVADGVVQLFRRDMNTYEVEPIPGTEGATHPFFSPEGDWIGFLTVNQVKKVALDGSSPSTLVGAHQPVKATWAEDDWVYFTEGESSRLSRVHATSLEYEEVASETEGQFFSQVLQDGGSVLTSVRRGSISGNYAEIYLVDLDTKDSRPLGLTGYAPHYGAGHLFFGRSGDLYAVPFDAGSGEVSGDEFLLASDARMDSLFYQLQVAASEAGTVVFVPGGDASIGNYAWVDRLGATSSATTASPNDAAEFLSGLDERVYGVAEISPDSRRIAIQVADVADFILIYDIEEGRAERLDTTGGNAGWPVWGPGPNELTFARLGADTYWRYLVQDLTSQREPRELIGPGEQEFRQIRFSPDRRIMVAQGLMEAGLDQAGFMELNAEGNVTSGWQPLFPAIMPSFSPGGTHLTYYAAPAGEIQVWVHEYGGNRQQITTTHGIEPQWCVCAELFFRSGSTWMASEVTFDPEFDFEPARIAFETDFIDTPGMSYDVTDDGQRLLVVKRTRELPRDEIRVIQNWRD